MRCRHTCFAIAAGIVLFSVVPSVRAEGWHYTATLHGWFVGIDGTVGAGRASDVPVTA